MTKQDREKWESRYRDNLGNLEPSFPVERFVSLASCGKALDIACGSGRNSLFLAEKGFRVDAVDISATAIEHVAGLHPGIRAMCLDLDSWMIPIV